MNLIFKSIQMTQSVGVEYNGARSVQVQSSWLCLIIKGGFQWILTFPGLLWNQRSSWCRPLVFSTSLLCPGLRSPEPWRSFTGPSATDSGGRMRGWRALLIIVLSLKGADSQRARSSPRLGRVPVVCVPLLQDHVSPLAGYRVPPPPPPAGWQ